MYKSIVTFILLIYSYSVFSTDTLSVKIIAQVNGLPVTVAELKREMQRYRSEIYTQYATSYNISEVKNFWNTDFKGIKPIDSLRNRALKALTEIKVQQQMLEGKKLWLYKNYKEFQVDLQHENEQRQQKVQQKEIIYGPTVYTEQVLFDYKFSNALIALKHHLTGNKIPVNDSLLMNHYILLKKEGVYSDKKTFNNFKKQVQDNYIEREYKKLVAAKVKEARVIKIDGYNNVMI